MNGHQFKALQGDCLDVMRDMPDASVDAIVTDPPYGLKFMGKEWDETIPSVAVWEECLRVLKPGGHLLAFAGTRTQHRMAVRIEDAGFEIRDMIAWVYGSGFPKSLDVSKAIDKAAGAEREVVGPSPFVGRVGSGRKAGYNFNVTTDDTAEGRKITAPATPAARQWSGWGTALKPALEPITVARKPLIGTVAANVQEWGTGAINVDGGRVETTDTLTGSGTPPLQYGGSNARPFHENAEARGCKQSPLGRWPANFLHDGSGEVTELLGDAARFFYCPKASKRDRDDGLDGFERGNNMRVNAPRESEEAKRASVLANTHPTVKPTDLMRYLCRLVTPPGGLILDPFMGSGSTGRGAVLEGFRFIGAELDPVHVAVAEARIQAALNSLEKDKDAA